MHVRSNKLGQDHSQNNLSVTYNFLHEQLFAMGSSLGSIRHEFFNKILLEAYEKVY